jgi:hypothetical protein
MIAEPTECINVFANRMVMMASQTGEVILGEFNQHTLEARPGDTRKDVMKPWNDAQRESYLNR